jgi:hypothetical protein
MKRLLVLVAVLVPLSMLIAGCGDSGGASKKDSGPYSQEEKQKMGEKMQQMMKSGKTNSGR